MPLPQPRPALRRPAEGRWVAGVAAGLAVHLGVPVAAVRAFLVALAALGGAGVVGYALLWALIPAEEPPPDRAEPDRRARRPRWSGDRETAWQLLWGIGLVVLGGVLLAQQAGLPLDPAVVVPAALAVAGAAVAWSQLDAAERGRWLASAGGGTPGDTVRLAAGVLLCAVGIVLLVAGGADAAAVRTAVLASGAVLLGIGLLLTPWVLRLVRDLAAERAARDRETERAEVAAHLHDSVLQTLSLIQRRAGDPAEVSRLARGQERELRGWLYGGATGSAASSLADAVRRQVADVEDSTGVPVEVVVVGDRPLDRAGEALVQALREATLNATRHGRPPVQVYVEASPAGVEAFVRDHGDGFEPDDVPPDRLGVRESVVGRMERAGGGATIRRAPGGGTEVALRTAPQPADRQG